RRRRPAGWRGWPCSRGPMIGLEPRLDLLLVEKLRQPLLSPALGIEELRLFELRVEIVLGLIPAHRAAVLEAELRRAQHDGILLEQLACERLHLRAQFRERHARVDEAHLRGPLAVEGAARHDVEQTGA